MLHLAEVVVWRWEVVCYLNMLESILSAWHHGIADKKIIEEEFKYLIDPKDNHGLLPKFRKVAGDSYPAITAFANHLQKEKPNKCRSSVA